MTTPHHLRCDWLEEARMRLLGQAIIFHDELFVKVITMNDVIGELKKERKGCYDANSTLQPKPGHCGHESEPTYSVTKEELDMIKNNCAYPESQFCDGCEYADGEDPERASGLGCNFIGANALMDEVLTRKQPSAEHDATIRREAYEQGKRDALLEKDNLQVSTVVGFEAGYDQGAREERERVLDEVYQKLLSDMNDRSFVDSDGDFIQCIGLSMDEIDDAIKSLRSSK